LSLISNIYIALLLENFSKSIAVGSLVPAFTSAPSHPHTSIGKKIAYGEQMLYLKKRMLSHLCGVSTSLLGTCSERNL